MSERLGLAVEQRRAALLELGLRDLRLRELVRRVALLLREARLLLREARLLLGNACLRRRPILEPGDGCDRSDGHERPPSPPDAVSPSSALRDERALQRAQLRRSVGTRP